MCSLLLTNSDTQIDTIRMFVQVVELLCNTVYTVTIVPKKKHSEDDLSSNEEGGSNKTAIKIVTKTSSLSSHDNAPTSQQ